MYSERMSVMARKVKISEMMVVRHKAISLSVSLVWKTKPTISNGNPKYYREYNIWKCSQSINDFESKDL